MKRCIIFSYGPVPAPEHTQVEGGGLRCWGLAKGLKENDPSLQVTVAYNEHYKKEKFTEHHEGINITTWHEETVESMVQDYDSTLVSYCMGDLSTKITDSVRTDQQLILDCNVPIYVEMSARESANISEEYTAFLNEVNKWSYVLRRGDVFLCANENQKRFYQGVLAGLGRINPATYNDEFILVVPYGIYREAPIAKNKPITKLVGGDGEVKKILWFGGIYPWFDLRVLVDAVCETRKKVPAKLVIVGAKNPFNDHPDFNRRYDELVEHIEQKKERKDAVIIQDWVNFYDRADWYLDSDLVVLVNKIGSENELAWRTRLVDFMWADLPIITNGGDPLGEHLIGSGAAVRLTSLDKETIASEIVHVLQDDKQLQVLKKQLKEEREHLYWDKVTAKLADYINNSIRPTDITNFGLLEVLDGTGSSILRRVGYKLKKMPAYYKKHGARSTLITSRTILERQAQKVGLKKTDPGKPKVIFIAHQLDTTGAPHVFIDMVSDFRKMKPSTPVEFHTFNPADNVNIVALNKIGLRPKLHLSRDIRLNFSQGDVVVLNTVAFSDTLKENIFDALEQNNLRQLIWFIHEDEPELIFNPSETKRIGKLLKAGKIKIFTAASKTRTHYAEHFKVAEESIETQMYRIDVPEKYHKIRKPQDFDKLDFILPGMVSDGRKGQLPLLYAFIEFKQRYYDQTPEKYRDFSLTYIGLHADFLSRQLLKHAPKGLGDRFKYFQRMPHKECLERGLEANITICYSLRECLPMFVYEGMIAGHPILRNDSSGQEEQLVDGKNGFHLDSKDFEQVISTIESICNKEKTSSSKLAEMSHKSHDIAASLSTVSYKKMVDTIEKAFSNSPGVELKS